MLKSELRMIWWYTLSWLRGLVDHKYRERVRKADMMGIEDDDICDSGPAKGHRYGCHISRLCVVCQGPAPASERCTNGRCAGCHRTHCTPLGLISPGHAPLIYDVDGKVL